MNVERCAGRIDFRSLGASAVRWIVALAFGMFMQAAASANEAANEGSSLGINLAAVNYYSSEIVFVDAMKAASPWISQMKNKPWGKGGPLELDRQGNVLRLAPNQWADALLFADIGPHYPAGDYTCLYDGRGEIEFAFAGAVKEARPGRIVVAVEPQKGQVGLRLKQTDPDDPVRNIRLILPGFEASYANEPFHPDFLRRWERFKVLRFMDWQRTNNQPLGEWSDRPLPDDFTQGSDKGVALEYIFSLCNRLGADAWVCLPHHATDDFVRQFARLARAQLDGSRKIYIEYSNETWNGQFTQAQHCRNQGLRLKLAPDDFSCQLRYSAQRSVEIFRLWEKAFGGRKRLVRVISAQAANPWTAETQLNWQHADADADALAIAPYYGHEFGQVNQAGLWIAQGPDRLLDACHAQIVERKDRLLAFSELVRGRHLRLLAYEGGQHLAGVGGAENNDQLTAVFHAANRAPRMKDLYLADLQQWREAGGDLFCCFSSMGRYSRWGAWGLLEHGDQRRTDAPKYDAALEFLDQTQGR